MTAEDSKGTVTRTFDALNRVTSYTDTLGNTVGYEYDCVGNLSKLTYPDNTEVIYEYDKNNNLVKVTDWAGRVTTYTYDSNNRVTGVKKPDGSVTTTAYDAAGRAVSTVETVGTTTISGFEYVYDELGRISSESDLANRLKLCYTYDDLSRVINRTAVSLDNNNNLISSEEFGYDHAGNLSTDEYVYDTSNRLIGYNGTSLVYDLDGNLLTASEMSLGYDFANRLVRANEYEYTYDVENIRVKKCIGESITEYTHNANSKLSQLLTKTENNVTTKYVYGLGLIGQEEDGVFKTYHYDYRGSTVALTDLTGDVTDTFTYDTYGKLTTRTGTSSTPFLYNGRDGVMSDENGLVYMRARYYSPTFKRFINADVIAGSITNSITLNRYAYANGNPVSNVDPFGLSADEARGTQGTAISTDKSSEDYIESISFTSVEEVSAVSLDPNSKDFLTFLQQYMDNSSGAFAIAGAVAILDSPLPGSLDIAALVISGATILVCISLAATDVLKQYPMVKPKTKVEAKAEIKDATITTVPPDTPTVIYRYGGTNPGNLVPSEKDVLLNSGLSFSLVPKPNSAVTTIEALNATGVLRVVQDSATHVSVYPVGGTIQQWRAQGTSSIWTQAIKSVVVKNNRQDGGLNYVWY